VDGEDPVSALEARLGIPISERATALAALTHKSYVNEHRDEGGLADNERLEFLGDAVIDLAVSQRLMEQFPGAREGELSKMRAAVVDEQGLSEMARALELGSLLRLGRGEELTGGRQKASLLADAMEAVVAALYVGAGLGPVLTLIDRFLGEAFARAAAGTLDRDFKTQLQEVAQSRLRATPRYRVVAEHGPDHSKLFEVETELRGEVLGRGAGRSKKDAEQAAAKLALDALGRRLGTEAEPRGPGAVGSGGEVLAIEGLLGTPPGRAPQPEQAPDEVLPPAPEPIEAGGAAERADAGAGRGETATPAPRRRRKASARPRAAVKRRTRATGGAARKGSRRKR
jgi:ribonuclease-3